MTHGHAWYGIENHSQHAIVRRDEIVATRFSQQGAATAAYAWVNHHNVNGARREARPHLRKRVGGFQNRVWCHSMSDICKNYGRAY